MQKLDRWNRIVWMLVGLGVGLRLMRYLLAFPLWGDECMVATNFLTRGYADLLRPLDHCQVAPPLFLVLELTAVKLLGFSEWSLRLVPLLSGIVALLVFKHLAGRLLRGPAYALAVGLMAVAFYPMRHSAEVKPYASDLLVAVVLLALAVEWWSDRNRTRWLWALVATMPLALGLSFPAVFVAGGISLLLMCELYRSRDRSTILPVVAYHVALAVSLAGLMAVSAATQLDEWGPMMRACWVTGFPPSPLHPVLLLRWLAETYTGHMFAYPLGGSAGGSVLTLVCFLAGLAAWMRRGDRRLAVMLLAPFGLGLLSAALRLYPYGDNERLVQYLGPAICLLTGLGIVQLVARLRPASRQWALPAIVGLLGVIAGGEAVFDLVHPYKHRCDWDHQSFARWFWSQSDGSTEVVAMPHALNAAVYDQTDYCAYLCYRAIYGRRLKAASAVTSSPVKPLDCVVFRGDQSRPKQPALDVWLKQFAPRYQLAGCTSHRVKTDVGPPHDFYGWYDVYRFVPREGEAVAQGEIQTQRK
jgi:hypothetical protein